MHVQPVAPWRSILPWDIPSFGFAGQSITAACSVMLAGPALSAFAIFHSSECADVVNVPGGNGVLAVEGASSMLSSVSAFRWLTLALPAGSTCTKTGSSLSGSYPQLRVGEARGQLKAWVYTSGLASAPSWCDWLTSPAAPAIQSGLWRDGPLPRRARRDR